MVRSKYLGVELLGKSDVLGAARRWVPLTPDSSKSSVPNLGGSTVSQIHFRFHRTQTLGTREERLHGAAPGGPLATPGRVEGAGPHRRFCGGWAQPRLLSVLLGVGARCAVVAAHQPAATDGALMFAQVSSRWAHLLEQIVLEARSTRRVQACCTQFSPPTRLEHPCPGWPIRLSEWG